MNDENLEELNHFFSLLKPFARFDLVFDFSGKTAESVLENLRQVQLLGENKDKTIEAKSLPAIIGKNVFNEYGQIKSFFVDALNIFFLQKLCDSFGAGIIASCPDFSLMSNFVHSSTSFTWYHSKFQNLLYRPTYDYFQSNFPVYCEFIHNPLPYDYLIFIQSSNPEKVILYLCKYAGFRQYMLNLLLCLRKMSLVSEIFIVTSIILHFGISELKRVIILRKVGIFSFVVLCQHLPNKKLIV